MTGEGGRISLEKGLILHQRPYRESSLLIEAITEHHGRIRLLAKGVRRGKRPLSEILRPFNSLDLSWQGRGDLLLLTGAEQTNESWGLRGRSLFCGFYLNELLSYFLPIEDPNPVIYRLYVEVLSDLLDEEGLEAKLRHFELDLLEALGYGPRLEEDGDGRPIDVRSTYLYRIEGGAFQMVEGTDGGVSGATLRALSERSLSEPGQLLEAKRLMRTLLAHHLNGRKLKSRDLFRPPSTDIR